MFTGIVSDVGTVREVSDKGDRRFAIATSYDMASIAEGASIACAGVCLTVVGTGAGHFAITASAETLARTTLGGWRTGTRVNLERPLRLGDELGGHLVTGHVDDVAVLIAARPEGASLRWTVEAPAGLARFIAEKGSVALDGVSLTVNEVAGGRFGVNLIPHTLGSTTLGAVAPGDRVNLEIDILARYVQRLVAGVSRP